MDSNLRNNIIKNKPNMNLVLMLNNIEEHLIHLALHLHKFVNYKNTNNTKYMGVL
jgi:hypothetical protein